MKANERQVAGSHYTGDIQHWDYVWANKLDYFQAQITKYVTRCHKKNGVEDLKKAQHFLEKYIELLEQEPEGCICGYPMGHVPGCPMFTKANDELAEATKSYVNQD